MKPPYARLLVGAMAALVLASPSTVRAGMWPAAPSDTGAGGAHRFEANGFLVPAEDFPVRVALVGEPPEGLGLADVEQAIERSAAAWSSVSCAAAHVEYAGHRPSSDALEAGEIPIRFTSPSSTSCFPSGTIAWTSHSCDHAVFLNTVEYDWSIATHPFQAALTEPDGRQTNRLVVDVQSAVTHELGHVLGMAHSSDQLATMVASYKADGGQRRLAVDDRLGLCALYPRAHPPDECRAGRDCRPRERCGRVQGVRMCQELRGTVGDACAHDRLICEQECVFAANRSKFGYCTRRCGEPGQSCPADFECLEGLIRSGEHHCQRVSRPDEPTCTAARPTRLLAPGWSLLWVLAALGLVVRRARLPTRSSDPR